MQYRRRLAWVWLLVLALCAMWPDANERAATEPSLPSILSPPSAAHWIGTDDRGRDVAWRLLAGARPVVIVAIVAAAAYIVVGVVFGIAGGLWRIFGLFADRVIELGLVLPAVYLLLAVRAFFGPPSALLIGLALGFVYGPHAARLCRAETERVLSSAHVDAARATGVPTHRLFWVHVLPTAIRPALALATLALGQAALFEGALGAIGLGLAPPAATWGELLQQAAAQPRAWWLWMGPTVAIVASVLATRNPHRG